LDCLSCSFTSFLTNRSVIARCEDAGMKYSNYLEQDSHPRDTWETLSVLEEYKM
jgi:hypothetical protein